MHRVALILCLGSLVACGKSKSGDAPPAAATTGAVAGQVVELSGTVTATRGGASRSLAIGDAVRDDDAIATGADGRVAIKLARNGVVWRLGPNLSEVVARSSAWNAPTADDGVAGISGDHSAAAGRHAEREAADTAASAAAAPAMDTAAAPSPAAAPVAAPDSPADVAPADLVVAEERAAATKTAAPRRAHGARGAVAAAASDDPLAGLGDDDEFSGGGGLGLRGTGPGGGGASLGGSIGGTGSLGGGGGGGGGAANADTKPADAPPNLQAESRALNLGEQKVAPPAIVCERGALTVTGPRPRADVARVIAAAQVALRTCAVDGDEAAAHAMLAFSIGADGKPRGVKVTGASAAFATCVGAAVGKLQFAAATGADSAVTQALEIRR